MKLLPLLLLLISLPSAGLHAAEQTSRPPQIRHVAAVAPDVLSIEIHTGVRIPARQQSYQRGMLDWIDNERDRHRWVRSGKEVLGTLAGPADNLLYPFDGFTGNPLDTAWADNPASYRISSPQDNHYQSAVTPLKVFRKSRPTDTARVGFWDFRWPMAHTLYLQLPQPLREGVNYRIELPGSPFATLDYQHDTRRVRSEAVHISQVGFRNDDTPKIAFLSLWRGSGGAQDYLDGLPFEVIDTRSNQIVFRGKSELARRVTEHEDVYLQNYNGTDVFHLRFDTLQTTGEYRVCVMGTGCSYPFTIGPQVWAHAFFRSVRGLYHQRSGIELTAPYTHYRRPRNMHPDDGFRVYQSRTPLMDTKNGIHARGKRDDNFSDLIAGKTPQVVDQAWGGYADAGDWDRRIQHLHAARLLLELAEVNPAFFTRLPLNIPESGNTLPDVVDEALWGLEFFRRLQTPEGGVRGGIESSDHPRHGEASWQESQTLIAYAPGIWSSHVYAGVAARAARVLQTLDPQRAALFRHSALAAMQWAEQQLQQHNYRELPHEVRDDRNLAAAELYRLTREERWHRLFLATTAFIDPKAPLQKWKHHDQTEAAYVYLKSEGTDPVVSKNIFKALMHEANQSISTGLKTGFRWTKRSPSAWLGWGNLTAPEAVNLIRAHQLTGDNKYLQATLLAAQYGAGANPLNMSFTTGVGHNFPRHPLIQDQRVSGQFPPEGITVNGPLETKRQLKHWLAKLFAPQLYPPHASWPTMEAYFDVYDFAPLNEFTVQSTIAPNAYVWGYLAARR